MGWGGVGWGGVGWGGVGWGGVGWGGVGWGGVGWGGVGWGGVGWGGVGWGGVITYGAQVARMPAVASLVPDTSSNLANYDWSAEGSKTMMYTSVL